MQMLEHVSYKQWWTNTQTSFYYTLALWLVFGVMVVYRTDFSAEYSLTSGLTMHIENLVAHPSFTNERLNTPSESQMPCRCSCRLSPVPNNPCDSDNSEVVDFNGLLSRLHAELMVQNHNGVYPAGADVVSPMSISEVQSPKDSLFWVLYGILPIFWDSTGTNMTARPGLVLDRNLIVGGVRVRQSRVGTTSNCQVPSAMKSRISTICRLPKPSQDAYVPQGLTSPQAAVLAFTPSAAGPAGSFDAMFDIERPVSNALDTGMALWRRNWLDASTKSLRVETLLMNAEVQQYVFLNITFNFNSDGSVDHIISVEIAPIPIEGTIMTFLPEIIWFLVLILIFIQICLESRRMFHLGGCCGLLKSPWWYFDFFSVFFGFAIAVYWYYGRLLAFALSAAVGNVPVAPLPPNLDPVAYDMQWGSLIDQAVKVMVATEYYQLCLVWYASVITFRFLKVFRGQGTLAKMQIVILDASWEILHLLLIFIVTFGTFAMTGRILFGSDVKEWGTYVQAAGSAVQVLLGYQKFQTLYNVRPRSAHIWYWLFQLAIMWVLMNLLKAIIIDQFGLFRQWIPRTTTLPEDIGKGWADFRWRLGWRRDKMREDMDGFKEALFGDPYKDLVEELIQKCNLPAEKYLDAHMSSCLGIVHERRKFEDLHVKQGEEAADVEMTQMGIRECGADAATADHLLETCGYDVAFNKKFEKTGHIQHVRKFMTLMQSYNAQLRELCSSMEADLLHHQDQFEEVLDRLEGSLRHSFEAFQELRVQGVDTLAPPLLGEGGEMKEILHKAVKQAITNGDPHAAAAAPALRLAALEPSGSKQIPPRLMLPDAPMRQKPTQPLALPGGPQLALRNAE